LLGLPLHPLLVHFPLAFWLSVPMLDLFALGFGLEPWWFGALGLTAAGVVIGALAIISGLLDYIHLSETGSNDVRLAAKHGVRTSLVWCAMTLKLIIVGISEQGQIMLWTSLIVDLLAAALLLQGAFFGTKITYGGFGN
ncbi:MAG: DUF2231 domain-containing protein, partial [Gammaproteobacteria bacterium]